MALIKINVFMWLGSNVRPIFAVGGEAILYSYLPSGFFRTTRDRLTTNIKADKIRQVPRSE